ncbi:hypothetical protein Fmac_027287 [Flemingia macrophylla]|uniref:Uncharacterized protein n=1 Tax=Flemingia macrophylla TaxID=520843 RepID=A0ABD1LHT6_9FABA
MPIPSPNRRQFRPSPGDPDPPQPMVTGKFPKCIDGVHLLTTGFMDHPSIHVYIHRIFAAHPSITFLRLPPALPPLLSPSSSPTGSPLSKPTPLSPPPSP